MVVVILKMISHISSYLINYEKIDHLFRNLFNPDNLYSKNSVKSIKGKIGRFVKIMYKVK